jgi:hypothetical protein
MGLALATRLSPQRATVNLLPNFIEAHQKTTMKTFVVVDYEFRLTDVLAAALSDFGSCALRGQRRCALIRGSQACPS